MKKYSLIFVILLIGFQSFALHPLKLSVVDMTHSGSKIHVKMKLFVEDMDAVMGLFTKGPFSLVNFANKDIDATTQKQISAYVATKFSMDINNSPLKFTFKRAYLDQEKLFTDYAVVYVELETKWNISTEIKFMGMTNELCFETIPEQKNMVNIHIGRIDHVFEFDNQSNTITQKAKF